MHEDFSPRVIIPVDLSSGQVPDLRSGIGVTDNLEDAAALWRSDKIGALVWQDPHLLEYLPVLRTRLRENKVRPASAAAVFKDAWESVTMPHFDRSGERPADASLVDIIPPIQEAVQRLQTVFGASRLLQTSTIGQINQDYWHFHGGIMDGLLLPLNRSQGGLLASNAPTDHNYFDRSSCRVTLGPHTIAWQSPRDAYVLVKPEFPHRSPFRVDGDALLLACGERTFEAEYPLY